MCAPIHTSPRYSLPSPCICLFSFLCSVFLFFPLKVLVPIMRALYALSVGWGDLPLWFLKTKKKRKKFLQKNPNDFLFSILEDYIILIDFDPLVAWYWIDMSIVYVLNLSLNCVISTPSLTLAFHYSFNLVFIHISLLSYDFTIHAWVTHLFFICLIQEKKKRKKWWKLEKKRNESKKIIK